MTTEDHATILWQRLDLPGHDIASLRHDAAPAVHSADGVASVAGWHLSGVAVLAHASRPSRMEYDIVCDSSWVTRSCTLRGYIGATPVALDITRNSRAEWTVGGAPAHMLNGCDDIDLGFTPATNLLPIRRLDLPIGAKAPVRAAWVKFPDLTLEVLEQTYTRLAHDRYLYESAGGAFRRELLVDDVGFVVEYPDFWRAEART